MKKKVKKKQAVPKKKVVKIFIVFEFSDLGAKVFSLLRLVA